MVSINNGFDDGFVLNNRNVFELLFLRLIINILCLGIIYLCVSSLLAPFLKFMFRQGLSSQSIWLDALYSCSSSDNCLTSCQACPTRGNHNCDHSEDVTLQCGKKLISSKSVF